MSTSKIIYTIIVVAVVAALAYFGFRAKPAAQEINTPTPMDTQQDGLKYEIIKEGTGAEVKVGDVAVVNYTGMLTDGTVFDSSVLPEFNHVYPFEFTVGAGHVIKGWDLGVAGMKIGEKRKLTLAPEFAYGSRAAGKIPANSTLIFEVELVGIKHD